MYIFDYAFEICEFNSSFNWLNILKKSPLHRLFKDSRSDSTVTEVLLVHQKMFSWNMCHLGMFTLICSVWSIMTGKSTKVRRLFQIGEIVLSLIVIHRSQNFKESVMEGAINQLSTNKNSYTKTKLFVPITLLESRCWITYKDVKSKLFNQACQRIHWFMEKAKTKSFRYTWKHFRIHNLRTNLQGREIDPCSFLSYCP